MKKLYFVLLLIIVSFGLAIAGDTIKVLRIYNGGVGTSIPLANIDSLTHPKYDGQGNLLPESVNAVLETIDSTYNIPVASIDSIVIADIDMEEFNSQVDKIRTYIDAQECQEIGKFQNDLIAWLDAQDWVSQVSINDNKDYIVIAFTNGLDLFIDFQYIDNNLNTNTTSTRGVNDINKYIDVSYKEEEEIIDKKEVMYIQGRDMFHSNATKEFNKITKSSNESPIDLNIKTVIKKLTFFEEDYSKYGLVLISQTHGVKDVYGSFEIEYDGDENGNKKIQQNGLILDVFNAGKYFKILTYYVVKVDPQHMAKVIGGNSPIIYGNYCWSWGLADKLNKCTIFGHDTEAGYKNNYENMTMFITNIFNGLTYEESIEEINKPYTFNAIFTCYPVTNHPNSKQRYFSISTEDINKNDVGFLVIKGKINGYDNLKKDELKNSFFVYCHEGGEDFTPESDNIEKFDLEINEDGTFEKLLYADATRYITEK